MYIEKYTDGKPALFTSVSRQEGEVVCGVSQLLFDSLAKLQAFLGTAGNTALADRLLKVTDVVLDEDGAPQSVFGVMVGAAGHMRHHAGVRRGGPNVAFMANPRAGVGDGFVQLVVRTRNHAGIRPKSLLAADFGIDWVATESTSEGPAAKKFRGALDSYFQQLCDESKAACPPGAEACPPPPDETDNKMNDLARPPAPGADKNAHLAPNDRADDKNNVTPAPKGSADGTNESAEDDRAGGGDGRGVSERCGGVKVAGLEILENVFLYIRECGKVEPLLHRKSVALRRALQAPQEFARAPSIESPLFSRPGPLCHYRFAGGKIAFLKK